MMARSDLAAVQPTALRRAAHELSQTLWTSMLSYIRGYTKEVLYHEACGAWLGGLEGRSSTEAIKFHSQWTMFGNFIVVGSFLQVEVLMNKVGLPVPRFQGGFRRRRQADTGLDIKTIYSLVMHDLKTKGTVAFGHLWRQNCCMSSYSMGILYSWSPKLPGLGIHMI